MIWETTSGSREGQTEMKKYSCTIYASYFGYITQAIVNNLAPLLFLIFQQQFGLSLGKITLITTINFLIQLVVDLLSAKFIDRIGYRISIVAAHIFAAAGLIGLGVLPFLLRNPYAGILISVVLYAVGGGLIEVLISPIVEACPSENKAAAMSLLHSFYCWGTVAVVALSTLFLAVFGKENWRILTVIWAIIPIVNAFCFCRVPIDALTEEGEGMTISALAQTKLFWVLMVLMVAAGASEQGMSQWASAFAEEGLHVSKLVGDLAGPCFFSVLMGAARAYYGKCGEKLDLLKFIRGSSTLCILSYLIAVFSPSTVLSLIGCGLCGLSVGIMWPGVFSLASARLPKGGTALFALLALGGDVGCSAGPTLVGFMADVFGGSLKSGLLFAVIFPVVLLLFSGALRGKAE
jgi:fucose permease